MSKWRSVLCSLALVVGLCTNVFAGDDCISGTISATPVEDESFPPGTWKYCITLSWSVDASALSHVSVFPGLQGCECKCEEGFITFPDPAGTSTGPADDGEKTCTLDYTGDYVCGGDPSLPSSPGPAIKFEPDGDCEPGLSGTGTFCFYVALPPGPEQTLPDGLVIKHGGEACFGPLTGTMPNCSEGCEVLPVTPSTWTNVKDFYR